LLCYFHIAICASGTFKCTIVGKLEKPRVGKTKVRWPKKPGLKANFSYLSLSNKNGVTEIFQLCPGIKITDIHGKDRAPDVNLLTASAPDKPDYSHLNACWDAKHTNRVGTRLPDTAVSDFVFTYQQLGSPTPPTNWVTAVSEVICHRSGLLTNGDESTEPVAVFILHGLAETKFFPDAPITRP